ncbi:transmembrane protein 42 [Manacus vitellinus]|uniref:transmembrane protein 42 n=1 Tax=Manacus vitellinus TaxID=328815 RepID=UPI00115EF113|nr:transmembrane protein 42 [Manacus vitellinus]
MRAGRRAAGLRRRPPGCSGRRRAAAAKLALGPGGEAAGARLSPLCFSNLLELEVTWACCPLTPVAVSLPTGVTSGTGTAELPVLLRVSCVGLVFACNAVMWTVFAKALRLSSSLAAASVTTTASNFISSAILGKLLFGETWSPLWWVGLSTTLCGLMLLHTAAPQLVQVPAEKKE